MPVPAIIALCGLFFMILLMFFILFRSFGNLGKINLKTQHHITDRDLLQLIADQPDGLLSAKQLMAAAPGFSKKEAEKRLYALHSWGILQVKRNPRMQSYYSLTHALDTRPAPTLSPEPFLTVNDLILLFKHYDFKLTFQQLINATGLPWQTLKHELTYFQKKKVIQKLTGAASPYSGAQPHQFFVLRDPYRTEPDRFVAQEVAFNLELKTLLKKGDLL